MIFLDLQWYLLKSKKNAEKCPSKAFELILSVNENSLIFFINPQWYSLCFQHPTGNQKKSAEKYPFTALEVWISIKDSLILNDTHYAFSTLRENPKKSARCLMLKHPSRSGFRKCPWKELKIQRSVQSFQWYSKKLIEQKSAIFNY